ncbi:hypothetical protein AAVH_20510, partial [Aphelenchoides avenae]
KVGKLDSRQRFDLKATIGIYFNDIDPTGFKKYESREGNWVVIDLDNGLKLEIETRNDDTWVFIHVYSST